MKASEIVSRERDTRGAVPLPTNAARSGEQVLATTPIDEQELAKADQGLSSLFAAAVSVVSTLTSKRVVRAKAKQAAPATSAAVGLAVPRQSRKEILRKAAGGWRPSPRLAWREVKEIDDSINRLRQLGLAPTHCITIMPPAAIADDNKRKRLCVGKVGHIGEALKRHGTLHFGLTVFENPTDADLHAHHLAHVPASERVTVERFHNPPAVHVQRIHDLRGTVAYVTKQRQRLPPDFEREIKRPWQRGLPVPGKRWTTTLSARAILAGSVSTTTVAATADYSLSFKISKAAEGTSEPLQLVLKLAAPVVDLFALAEDKRKAEGIPQYMLASKLGIRQSQYSNAVVRRHDPLSPWRRSASENSWPTG